VITGKMLNKERQPVPGADVALFGSGHHAENYVATSGPDGVCAADVKAGRYRVWPSGRSLSHRTPPKFEPEHRDVSAHAGSMAHANFTVDIGLVVKLTLSATSVPADGFQIVQGTVRVTELGRPQPGVTVALWPQASEPASVAVSRGAWATICGPNGRIWPGATLSSPDGGSADVQTDSNGSYQFTLDVGTVPGPFSVTAWARDAHGALITHDTADASDDHTLGVSAIGAQPLDQFVPRVQPDREIRRCPEHLERSELDHLRVRESDAHSGSLQGVCLRARPRQRARRGHLSGSEPADRPARRLRRRRRGRPCPPAMGVDACLGRRDHRSVNGPPARVAAGAADLLRLGAGRAVHQLVWPVTIDAAGQPELHVLRMAVPELDVGLVHVTDR
jgi:hypothetical protein